MANKFKVEKSDSYSEHSYESGSEQHFLHRGATNHQQPITTTTSASSPERPHQPRSSTPGSGSGGTESGSTANNSGAGVSPEDLTSSLTSPSSTPSFQSGGYRVTPSYHQPHPHHPSAMNTSSHHAMSAYLKSNPYAMNGIAGITSSDLLHSSVGYPGKSI